jgi:hypothetical protein
VSDALEITCRGGLVQFDDGLLLSLALGKGGRLFRGVVQKHQVSIFIISIIVVIKTLTICIIRLLMYVAE